MKYTSERYKDEMKEPFKNKWLCKVTVGAVNNVLQTYGSITSSDTISLYSENLNDMLIYHEKVDKIATFEKNDTKADGTSLFYDEALYTGIIFDKILTENDTLSFKYNIDQNYEYRDVERLIINFAKNYPKKIKVKYDIADSPYFKEITFDNDSYEFKIDVQWENITYIDVQMSEFFKTDSRLAITDLLFGDILIFDNTNLSDENSLTYRQYLSFTSEELPYKELTLNVLNENQKYDIDDEHNDIQLLEKGQKVSIQFGYEFSDGYTEWLEDDELILNDYDINDTYLNIQCSDILNNMSDYVEVDTSSYVYDSSTKTLSEGYEDKINFDIRPGGFTPQGMHTIYEGGRKEGILMLANAYNEVIKIDSRNNINVMLNNFTMESVSGNFAPISNIDSIKDFYDTDIMYFRDYATFEKDYTKADGNKLFPIESNNEFTGFIGSEISKGDNSFNNPIELTIRYTDFLPESLSLIFVKNQAPRKFKYEIYDRFDSKAYTSDEITHDGSDIIALDLPIKGKYGMKSIKFIFIDMYKDFNTVHLKAVKDFYISNYLIDRSQYENYYPSCENERPIKSLIINGYKYNSNNLRSILWQGYPFFDENGKCMVLLNSACLSSSKIGFNEEDSSSPTLSSHGVSLKPINGKIKHVELTDNGYDDSILYIYGEGTTTGIRTQSYTFNKTGESIEITNNMIPDRDTEFDNISRWYYRESNYNKLYKINFMGDPSIENGDVISIERKKGDTIYIRVEKLETIFTGGGIRGYIEGRKI